MAETMQEFVKEQGKEEVKEETKTETTTTEKPETTTGQEVVKEDVVYIGGKPRPLKNYEAEIRRKVEEELGAKRETQTQTQQFQTQPNFLDQVYQQAENEIAMTGKTVPVQTIMQVANAISQRNLTDTLKVEREAQRTINNFKRSLRKEEDFAELEEDFDSLVEQLSPDRINAPTLEVLFNATRGKRVPEMKKRVKETTKEQIEKETEIVGGTPTQATGASSAQPTLTATQKTELDRMNAETNMGWTTKEYLEKLTNKQNRFKAMGAKNIPQTLDDKMIK